MVLRSRRYFHSNDCVAFDDAVVSRGRLNLIHCLRVLCDTSMIRPEVKPHAFLGP